MNGGMENCNANSWMENPSSCLLRLNTRDESQIYPFTIAKKKKDYKPSDKPARPHPTRINVLLNDQLSPISGDNSAITEKEKLHWGLFVP